MKTSNLKENALPVEIFEQGVDQQAEMQWWPFFFKRSGLYVKSSYFKLPKWPIKPSIPVNSPNADAQLSINLDSLKDDEKEGLKIKPILLYEEFRLDVDGRYPQMTASGYLRFPGVHYIAKLSKSGKNTYVGKIWYKYGNTASFPYTKVKITVNNAFAPSAKKVKVRFYAPGGGVKTSTYKFKSSYYRAVNFEYDCEQGVTPVTSMNTHDHPVKPAGIPNENISLDTIYRRAGFSVSRSNDNVVPSALKGANGKWSDMEMHDAMQTYWSKFSNAPNWALWTFFAKQHDMGPGLGGIMFDSIGPNHRQGTAVFNDSFINNVPAGESNPAAYRRRMKFWTAAHEMGHAFNLAHSWQKSLGTPWIPLANDPEARSFMNYPYYVSGGLNAFFNSFNYRFTNSELLFMRHAPNQFVQMGNNAWFDHHGLHDEEHEEGSDLKLELRINRPNNTVEYMEPVYIELKLSNTTNEDITVSKRILDDLHDIAIKIKKPNGEVEYCKSFVTRLFKPEEMKIKPGEAVYNSFFVSAGSDKWYIKESGSYEISAQLFEDNLVYSSNNLSLNVLNPATESQAALGTRYFTDEVARVLFFNGSKVLNEANQTLVEVLEETPASNAAMHAAVALANPYTKPYKVLSFDDEGKPETVVSAVEQDASFDTQKSNNKLALDYLTKATSDIDKFMDTYGHIESEKQINLMTEVMTTKKAAKELKQLMIEKFEERGVTDKVIKNLKRSLSKM